MPAEPNLQRRQGLLWIGTIPVSDPCWVPCLPEGIAYLKGQRELGEGGLDHFQIFFTFRQKKSLAQVRALWSPILGHWELTRSAAAEAYVWKEETRNGEPFEFGERSFRRNSKPDWDLCRQNAECGNFDDIPSDIFIRYYGNLLRICAASVQPTAMERTCSVLWGPTGTGKSRRAYEEAGLDSYVKDPRSKFWCGYANQRHAVIDEFRGAIDISHLLRWLDRYPVRVEVKGSSVALQVSRYWITSNIHPRYWYPELDLETYQALERRLVIEEMN